MQPPKGLFDKIILAIRQEEELQNTKRIVFGFFALLIVSVSAAPFSWMLFAGQVAESGLFQFVYAAASDFGTFVAAWPDFFMAIAESLPIAAISILTANTILAVFTLRLFLYKKRLLVGYLLAN